MGAKLGANGHSLRATLGHSQLSLEQLDGLVSDFRQRVATVHWCLLNSGSWIRAARHTIASLRSSPLRAVTAGAVVKAPRSRPLATK